MKKVIFFIVTLFISVIMFSQVSVFTNYSEGKFNPCVTISGTKMISEKIGITYFSLVQEKWAEAQIGLSYSPAEWITFGLSGGLEQNEALYRTGAFLWLGKGKTSFIALLEKGNGVDNYWYKSTFSYNVSPNLNLGLMAWRFIGVGPIAKYKIKDFSLWLLPTYEFENENFNLVFGVDIKI